MLVIQLILLIKKGFNHKFANITILVLIQQFNAKGPLHTKLIAVGIKNADINTAKEATMIFCIIRIRNF